MAKNWFFVVETPIFVHVKRGVVEELTAFLLGTYCILEGTDVANLAQKTLYKRSDCSGIILMTTKSPPKQFVLWNMLLTTRLASDFWSVVASTPWRGQLDAFTSLLWRWLWVTDQRLTSLQSLTSQRNQECWLWYYKVRIHSFIHTRNLNFQNQLLGVKS